MTNSNGNSIDQRIVEIHARIDGMDRDFTNRASIILDEVLVQQQQMEALTGQVDQLTDQVRYLTIQVDRVNSRVDQLVDRVDQLVQIQEITQSHVSQLAVTMVQFAQNAEADRTQMREMQGQIREIQIDIRGMQTENQRILRHLFGEGNNN
ncbi:hypothetical protein [Floridanema evergladense]|uniref:t-SNARE coiled-coil homology domain-containing protein n=1 Tax=Floridaenema evergladense BLCC-F167 TaxID=3153639 RepID=A0ABV4WJS7_9CYAN